MASDIQDYKVDGCFVDNFGEIDEYRGIITKIVRKLVKSGKWFTFCGGGDKRQVDIASVEGSDGRSLGSVMGNLYYSQSGYRTSVFKYFLRSYMCYYEVPIVKKSYGADGMVSGYEKFVATSNIAVIAAWLDIPMEEAASKFEMHLEDSFFDVEYDEFPYVRLTVSKEGKHTIRKPRTPLDLSKRGTRVIPMFALNEGVSLLNRAWSQCVVRLTYIKDGGDERVLDVSTDLRLFNDIYGNSSYYFEVQEKNYDGDFLGNASVLNGFLRVAEVGGSKYDSALRALSFSRIIGIEYNVEPNLMYVNIELAGVIDYFKKYACGSLKKEKRLASDIHDFGLMTDKEYSSIPNEMSLDTWVDLKNGSLGTTFVRSLAVFMLSDPIDFPNYTGEATEYSDVANSLGLDDEDDEVF